MASVEGAEDISFLSLRDKQQQVADLVLEDPAAGVHNAPFARALLADAEAALRAAGP